MVAEPMKNSARVATRPIKLIEAVIVEDDLKMPSQEEPAYTDCPPQVSNGEEKLL